jgi:hypothetical protein
MVDRLKRSLEHLEPPECPQCHVEMKWFESKLIKPEPAVVEHQSVCETCGGTRKRQQKVDENGAHTNGPARLARSPRGWASAA